MSEQKPSIAYQEVGSARKRVRVHELQVGMYVVEIPAPWISHRLWKSQFLIRDLGHLESVRQSGAKEVIIDTVLGVDVVGLATDGRKVNEPLSQAIAAQHGQNKSVTAKHRSPGVTWARAQTVVAETFRRIRNSQSIDEVGIAAVVEDIFEVIEHDRLAMIGLALLKRHDQYTYAHSVAVCALMVAFGRHLGMSVDRCKTLGTAGLFHDIGKAAMNDALLRKAGPLTAKEFEAIKLHPSIGAEILAKLRNPCPVAVDVCLHHHERMDGAGYAKQLTGQDLSMESKMAMICDVYDATTSDRPYKRAWDPAKALKKMVSSKGHFDRVLLVSFVSMLSPYPTGALVRLKSGRIGMVVQPSATVPCKPIVRVFYSSIDRQHITPRLIDLSHGTDEIIGSERAESWPNQILIHMRDEVFEPRQ